MTQWEVIGGADKGGILVREGAKLTSPQTSERLSTGAIVEQLELTGERLRYKLLEGSGPPEGWVSIKISGKDLLTPKAAAGTSTGSDWASRIAATLSAEPTATTIKAAGPWVSCIGKAPGKARARLLIFNWTGNRGGAGAMNAFTQWPKRLNEACPPETWEVCQVNLPGRGARVKEGNVTDAQEIARAVADALSKAGALPTVCFGFAFGSILAYETAALLAERSGELLGLCTVSAEHPSWTGRKIGAGVDGALTKDMTDDAFEKMLHEKGGTEAILKDTTMKQMYLPVIRSDMIMEEAYGASPPVHPKFTCPILAFRGSDCPQVSRVDAEPWLALTTCGMPSRIEELTSGLTPTDQAPWLSDWYLCQGEASSALIVKALACEFGGAK